MDFLTIFLVLVGLAIAAFIIQYSVKARMNIALDREIRHGSEVTVKKLEEDLSLEKKRFESIFENNLYGIATANLENKFTMVNDAFCEIMGYSKEELLNGMTVKDVSEKKYSPELTAQMKDLISGEIDSFKTEKNYIRKDGRVIKGRSSVTAIKNEHGEVVETVATIVDITGVTEVQGELSRSRQLYKSLFENNLHGIVRIDVDMRLKSVNPAFCKMLGYSKEELMEKTVMDISDPDETMVSKNLIDALNKGTIDDFIVEKKYLKKDRSILYANTAVRPLLDENESITGYVASIQDISQKKEAEEELREKQQILDGVIHNSSTVIFVKDDKGRYVLVNKEFERQVDLPLDHILHKKDRELFPPEIAEGIEKVDKSILTSGKLHHVTEELEIKGERRLFISNKFPIFRDDKPYGVAGIATDITDIRDAQVALEDSEARFRVMAETAPVAFLITRVTDDKIVFVNERFFSLFKYPKKTIEKIKGIDIYWDHDDQLNILKQTERGLTVHDYEILIKNNKDKPVWCRISSTRTKMGQEEVIFSAIEDISDRKKIEEALIESERQLKSVMKISPVGIYQCDVDGNVNYLNDKYLEIAGLEPEKARGMGWVNAIHPDDKDLVLNEWTNSLMDKRRFNAEYRFKKPDGTVTWLIGTAEAEKDISGNIKGYVGTITDINNRKKFEEERTNLIKELEMKNSEMERFTYTVSHDLKSPLVTIKGFLGMLEEDIKTNNEENIKTDIGYLNDAADNMTEMLQQLLELSRAVNTEGNYKKVSLKKVIGDAITNVMGQIDESNAQVIVDDILPEIYCDSVRLTEVFQNLIDNAIKFAQPDIKPQISIKVRSVRDRIELKVKDNGIGIEPRYLGKVFDLFERLDTGVAGTGVGLALVKRIIEKHGGTIAVTSKGAGKGSMFTINLPKLKAQIRS